MRYIIILLIPFALFAKTNFITQMEYASQFYKNPRGIGCHLCHGINGEGRIIANYVHKKEKKTFVGPSINNINFDKFYKTLNSRNRGMPRYFLTDKEIKALYFYLQSKKHKPAK